MKETIEKIDVCEPAVEQALHWLTESRNNGLNETSMNDVIRFLLKTVSVLIEGKDNDSELTLQRKAEKFDEIIEMLERARKDNWNGWDIHIGLIRITAYE